MIIHVYMMCYNEEILMPYFLRHYSQFADKIFVFDNYSTDNTGNIADANPKTTRTLYGDPNKHYNSKLISMKNEEYKKSKNDAEWVIVVDIDEFVYNKNIISLLQNYKAEGVTFPKVDGYDMIGDSYPKSSGQIYDEIQCGVPEVMFCKRAIFNPGIDINYVVGAHKCSPRGNVVESKSLDIKLLHYRFLCKEFFVGRMERRMKRISEEDIEKRWGALRLPPDETIAEWSGEQYEKRKKLRTKVV
jgi:glycosyltransferase involved in cell wall biosynthesis